jgi:hypothetical protein
MTPYPLQPGVNCGKFLVPPYWPIGRSHNQKRCSKTPLRGTITQRNSKKLICPPAIARVMCLVLLLLFCATNLALGCEHIAAGETFWVRLAAPVSSFKSERGSPVRAIVYESPKCNGVPLFQLGTLVEGTVKSVRPVGLGLIHETARLELQFGRLFSGSLEPLAFSAQVVEVANARESVKEGIIHGIQPTNTPQGRITSRLKHLPAWNPYTDWVLVAYRLGFPISPEPEIYLPVGTDLQLQLTAPLPVAGLNPVPSPNSDFRSSDGLRFDETVGSWPERTTTPRGENADIVNLVLIGSREQVESAFEAAGWLSSDPVSKSAVLHVFYAFLARTSYPRAPISKQLFRGQPSDSAWEKTLDSYGKREHLRIWSTPETWRGRPIWVSASSRETGASLSWSHRKFLHHVDSDLDAERDKVVRDLTLADCVDAVHESPRALLSETSLNATGDELRTRGGVAVVELKDCGGSTLDGVEANSMPRHPGNKLTRYLRTQILGVRSDLWRGNIIYSTYDVGRISIGALRRRNQRSSGLRPVN